MVYLDLQQKKRWPISFFFVIMIGDNVVELYPSLVNMGLNSDTSYPSRLQL
jgi:hypothetical protein